MKMKKVLFFVLVLMSLISCTAKKGFVTNLPKQEIEDVQRFPVLSNIFALDKNDYGFRSDSLSTLSTQYIDSYLDKQNNIDITGRIEINDTVVQRKINEEIRNLADRAYDNEAIAIIPIPLTIDSILEAQGKRFGLLIYAAGYERYEVNWQKTYRRFASAARGLPDFDHYYDFWSSIALIIVDADKNNIAFYNDSKFEGKPSRQYNIDRQFMELYYRYWR